MLPLAPAPVGLAAGLLPELLASPSFVAAAMLTFFRAAQLMFCLRAREEQGERRRRGDAAAAVCKEGASGNSVKCTVNDDTSR